MSKKKNPNPFRFVDGAGCNDVAFAPIHEAEARSPTYQKLSDSAKVTLMICKLCRQYHIGKDKNDKPRTINGDILCFYFNREIQRRYGLKNPNKVRKSLIELVSNGFIEVVESGWTTRTKSIYRFSSKWQQIDKGQEITFSPAEKAFLMGREKKRGSTSAGQ